MIELFKAGRQSIEDDLHAYFVFQLQAVKIFTRYRDFFPCFANIAMFEDFQGCR